MKRQENSIAAADPVRCRTDEPIVRIDRNALAV